MVSSVFVVSMDIYTEEMKILLKELRSLRVNPSTLKLLNPSTF